MKALSGEFQTTTNVLANVEELISNASGRGRYDIRHYCQYLGIFDWWRENLSVTQLKAMRSFLRTAHRMGFDGYVCFKVGATGCASGMWAYKDISTDGFSPSDSDFVYRSFYSSGNWWDAKVDGVFMAPYDEYNKFRTAGQLKEAMAE